MSDLSQFGTVKFIQRSNAHGIRITIRADKLTVSYGNTFTLGEAKKYLWKNATEILKKQAQLIEKTSERIPLLITPEEPLQTLTFKVIPTPCETDKIHFQLKDGILRANYPNNISIEEIQKYLWEGINYFLRKEAKRILPTRTVELAKQYDFKFKTVKIQASKTRWGSCSTEKNINLSFFLLLAPQYLIDYVILHELCHTIEMNHSDRFWALMDKVTDGKSKQLRQELRGVRVP